MPAVDANGNVYAKSWIRSIVEMCGEYTNFYTDLSYLPIFKGVRGVGRREDALLAPRSSRSCATTRTWSTS